MTELELNQISKDIKGILNNIYKQDKLKIITSLCNDIEEKFNITIDENTKEKYIKNFVGILNNKKQIKTKKIELENDNVINLTGKEPRQGSPLKRYNIYKDKIGVTVGELLKEYKNELRISDIKYDLRNNYIYLS
jgi:hypothetical protein|tara:strand:- start:1007 stop:1411 length:405 start_codon:yes stop_codon:yes gene_type:complete